MYKRQVLSAFFWFLTLLAYQSYAGRPTPARYSLTALLFAFGLLAKPMVVTLPFVLLLLDYWPLHRLRSPADLKPLLLEKFPFVTLSAGASIITFHVQNSAGAVVSSDPSAILYRAGNALETYVFYLEKIFWPRDLFVPYWYDFTPAAWPLTIKAAALAWITFFAVKFGRRHPYLPVGWFWFLGTLVPVIGLIQVGSQSSADRYVYLPSVGIFLILTWGAADLFSSWRTPRWLIASVTAIVISLCGMLTFHQIGFWRNSRTLFLHTLAVDPPNLPALQNLAWCYATDPDPTIRDGTQALSLASLCVQITRRQEPVSLRVLAAAYAESGQFPLAIETAEAARKLIEAGQRSEMQADLQADLEHYRDARALHDPKHDAS